MWNKFVKRGGGACWTFSSSQQILCMHSAYTDYINFQLLMFLWKMLFWVFVSINFVVNMRNERANFHGLMTLKFLRLHTEHRISSFISNLIHFHYWWSWCRQSTFRFQFHFHALHQIREKINVVKCSLDWGWEEEGREMRCIKVRFLLIDLEWQSRKTAEKNRYFTPLSLSELENSYNWLSSPFRGNSEKLQTKIISHFPAHEAMSYGLDGRFEL